MIEYARASIVGDSTMKRCVVRIVFGKKPFRPSPIGIRSNINNQTLNPYLEYISMVEIDNYYYSLNGENIYIYTYTFEFLLCISIQILIIN